MDDSTFVQWLTAIAKNPIAYEHFFDTEDKPHQTMSRTQYHIAQSVYVCALIGYDKQIDINAASLGVDRIKRKFLINFEERVGEINGVGKYAKLSATTYSRSGKQNKGRHGNPQKRILYDAVKKRMAMGENKQKACDWVRYNSGIEGSITPKTFNRYKEIFEPDVPA